MCLWRRRIETEIRPWSRERFYSTGKGFFLAISVELRTITINRSQSARGRPFPTVRRGIARCRSSARDAAANCRFPTPSPGRSFRVRFASTKRSCDRRAMRHIRTTNKRPTCRRNPPQWLKGQPRQPPRLPRNRPLRHRFRRSPPRRRPPLVRQPTRRLRVPLRRGRVHRRPPVPRRLLQLRLRVQPPRRRVPRANRRDLPPKRLRQPSRNRRRLP
jgi:hypothetical protein